MGIGKLNRAFQLVIAALTPKHPLVGPTLHEIATNRSDDQWLVTFDEVISENSLFKIHQTSWKIPVFLHDM